MTAPHYDSLRLDMLVDSDRQARKEYTKIEELAGSIASHGLLHPIGVRPREGDDFFVILYGHRRARALRHLGYTHIPALIFDLHAPEELIQDAENLGREDLDPFDEAAAFKRQIDAGMDIANIATAAGKDRGYVLRRMQLAGAPPELINMWRDGALHLAVAEMIMRLPTKEARAKGLGACTSYDGGAVSIREAREVLHEALCDLATAPFDTADAELVKRAGSCAACPKNSSNQPDLFGDLKGTTCTDASCYDQKADAAFARAAKEVEAAGGVVLDDKRSRQILSYSGEHLYDASFVGADSPASAHTKKTWSDLVGNLGELSPTLHLARTASGAAVRLYKRAEVLKAQAAADVKIPKSAQAELDAAVTTSAGDKAKAEERAKKRAAKAAKVASRDLVAQISEAVAQRGTEISTWRALLRHLVGRNAHRNPKRSDEMIAHLQSCVDADLGLFDMQAVCLDLLLWPLIEEIAVYGRHEVPDVIAQIAESLGIDWKAVHKEHREALKPKRKAKAKAKRKVKAEASE